MEISLVKQEPHSYATAVGDKRKGARYQVWMSGKLIGEVEKYSSPSHRSDGTTSRIRYGFQGYVVNWRATLVGELQTVTDCAYTRKQAVERLVEAHKEKFVAVGAD